VQLRIRANELEAQISPPEPWCGYGTNRESRRLLGLYFRADSDARLRPRYGYCQHMITRLARNEYIKREKYRGFTLTKTGRAVAQRIHLRRMTLMIFLQSLGLPRKVITRDVHGLEHHLSNQTLNCLTRLVRANRKSASRVKLTNHEDAPELQRTCSLPTHPKIPQQLVD